MMDRIYLDNAATSWPKPETVYRATDHAQREWGAPFGRAAYQQAIEVARTIEQTREQLAQTINAAHRRNIAFTFSCTDSLNTVFSGLLNTGDHVVTSVIEHNSVLRPLGNLESRRSISVTRVGCDVSGQLDPNTVIRAIEPKTKLVVLSHVSNVTGAIQDLTAIGKHCREQGFGFLVDAALIVWANCSRVCSIVRATSMAC